MKWCFCRDDSAFANNHFEIMVALYSDNHCCLYPMFEISQIKLFILCTIYYYFPFDELYSTSAWNGTHLKEWVDFYWNWKSILEMLPTHRSCSSSSVDIFDSEWGCRWLSLQSKRIPREEMHITMYLDIQSEGSMLRILRDLVASRSRCLFSISSVEHRDLQDQL